eukprot:14771584-Alexandrium_andersonii.AAC.1
MTPPPATANISWRSSGTVRCSGCARSPARTSAACPRTWPLPLAASTCGGWGICPGRSVPIPTTSRRPA